MKARTSFIAALVIALLAGGGYRFAAAQQGGGAFVPSFAYLISAAWTWTAASPFIFEGATDDAFETTLTITDPTADRTVTIQNATTTLIGRDTTDTLTNKTLTSPTVTTPTMTTGVSGSGTYTFPSSTGGIPIVVSCGVTSGSTDTCDNTATGATAKIFMGNAALLSGTGQTIVTGLSPAFTSTTTGACVGIDQSGASGVIAEVVLSGVSSLTVSGSGAGVVWWMCAGY